jgi:hypothetical protein
LFSFRHPDPGRHGQRQPPQPQAPPPHPLPPPGTSHYHLRKVPGLDPTPAASRIEEKTVTEINKDEKTVVAKSDFNVANVIAAIALLLLVLGLLKYFGVSPI